MKYVEIFVATFQASFFFYKGNDVMVDHKSAITDIVKTSEYHFTILFTGLK